MEREISYVQAIAEGLIQAMEADNRIFLIGEGVDNITGIYGIVLPAYKKFGEKRVIDTPLSENGLTGFVIGAAMDGMRPVLFHQRNDFMLLAMDQLVNNAAKLRYMSNEKQKAPLTIVSLIARKAGEGAQHSQSLQTLFAHIPGLKVVMPASPYNAKGLLASAIHDDDPVIVLYHRDLFEERGFVPEALYEVPLGKSFLVRSGNDITIIAVSATVKDALKAAEEMGEEISFDLIDLVSIRPFDKATILESVKKTGRVIVIDTSWKSFGISAEIVAFIAEEAFPFLKAPPIRIALPECPAPASQAAARYYHPNSEMITETISRISRIG